MFLFHWWPVMSSPREQTTCESQWLTLLVRQTDGNHMKLDVLNDSQIHPNPQLTIEKTWRNGFLFNQTKTWKPYLPGHRHVRTRRAMSSPTLRSTKISFQGWMVVSYTMEIWEFNGIQKEMLTACLHNRQLKITVICNLHHWHLAVLRKKKDYLRSVYFDSGYMNVAIFHSTISTSFVEARCGSAVKSSASPNSLVRMSACGVCYSLIFTSIYIHVFLWCLHTKRSWQMICPWALWPTRNMWRHLDELQNCL